MNLKLKDYGSILIGIVAGYFYTEIQRLFMPQSFRWTALIIAYFIIFLAVFAMIGPENPYSLSRFMSIWLTLIAALIILIEDIGIKHVEISRLAFTAPRLLATVIIVPFITGFFYSMIKKR